MRRFLLVAITVVGCGQARSPAPPPRAEFLVSAGDSSFWVASGQSGVHVRGSPILLARYDDRFYEIFVADDDFSYPDALLVGERLYRRDIRTGDSALVFLDTTVQRIAVAYARAHPDERPLDPDEETNADPATSATAELDVLEMFGPYLSYEYHADVQRPSAGLWHTTRRGVIDLRSGKSAGLTDVFGERVGRQVAAQGRRAYESARDSVLRSGAGGASELRGVDALARLTFDERSFALEAVDGRPAVRFAIPGRGEGPEGSVIELEPIAVEPTAWWAALRGALPESSDNTDQWARTGYRLIARTDTAGDRALIALADSGRHEWVVAAVAAPIHRVDWLDTPPLDSIERRALTRAFDQAESYDERRRIAVLTRSPFRFAAHRRAISPISGPHHASSNQNRRRKPARNLRAHDAG